MIERYTSHVVEGGVLVFTDIKTGERFIDGQRGRIQNDVNRDPSQMSQGDMAISNQIEYTESQAIGILGSERQQG